MVTLNSLLSGPRADRYINGVKWGPHKLPYKMGKWDEITVLYRGYNSTTGFPGPTLWLALCYRGPDGTGRSGGCFRGAYGLVGDTPPEI